jgi:type II secretory pathway pseudopilin PulG
MSLSRRGSSLFELLIALAVTGMLGTLAANILARAAFQLRDRSERMAAEHGLRVAASAVRSALESLGQDSMSGSDLLSNAAAGFSARATRAAGVACDVSPGRFLARAGSPWWNALRDPVAGRDSILAGALDSTGWRVFPLTAAPRPGVCPDGAAALELPTASDSASMASLGPGSPLRVVESVELRLYSSPPDQWLGMRLLATGQFIQPFAGPLTPTGFSLTYETRSGQAALLPADVASVSFRVEALTERAGGFGLIRGAAPRLDSVSGFVALVNSR